MGRQWLALTVLDEYVEQGWLWRRDCGDFLIYDYSDRTQWEKHWDGITMLCRGIVVDRHGNVVSRPFGKFFNLGEFPLPEHLTGSPRVYEKIDGSLIVASQYQGQLIVSSRRSMTSPHAALARTLLGGWMPQEGWTYCFELTDPDLRIVCDYGPESRLRLLAKIETATGREQDIFTVGEWHETASQYHLEWPFELEDHARPNAEGFILFWPEQNFRVKLKFAEYLRLHKLLTGVTPRKIWEILSSGGEISVMYQNVPDEFHAWARAEADKQQTEYNRLLEEAYFHLDHAGHLPRREIAATYRGNPLLPAIFRLLDGQDPAKILWKLVYPDAARPFALQDVS